MGGGAREEDLKCIRGCTAEADLSEKKEWKWVEAPTLGL